MEKLNSKKGAKLKVPKKGKRGLSKRRKRALEIFLQNPTISKEAAAQAAGFAPGQGSRVLNMDGLSKQIVAALGEKCGVTDAEVAQNIAMMLRANVLERETLGLPRLSQNQLDMFEANWFDVNGNPKTGLKGVRPDLAMRREGTRLLLEVAKSGADPERERKLYEAGVEAGAASCMNLIVKLQGYLSDEGKTVLADAVRKMSGGGAA